MLNKKANKTKKIKNFPKLSKNIIWFNQADVHQNIIYHIFVLSSFQFFNRTSSFVEMSILL